MYGAAADRGAAAASSGTASASSSSTRKQQGEAGMVAKLQRWIEETLREPVLAFHTSHSRGSSNSSGATSEALSHALADGVLLCRLAEAIRYACDLSVCLHALHTLTSTLKQHSQQASLHHRCHLSTPYNNLAEAAQHQLVPQVSVALSDHGD